MNPVNSIQWLQSQVIKTRDAVDAALALVPASRYSNCDAAGRKAFDDLSEALASHRAAVTLWRFAVKQEKRSAATATPARSVAASSSSPASPSAKPHEL